MIDFALSINISKKIFAWLAQHVMLVMVLGLSVISISCFIFYYINGLGLAYNDARSHLDIGRRVVDNLTPGFAQLGSVWLPLPHILMLPTIWNDFMWHSGLSGAIQSMVSYIATALLIYHFLKLFKVEMLGRIVGVLIFALNVNVLYMQSTAMTELLLLATMTAGCYKLVMWHKEESNVLLVQSAFWIMLSTLIRYDGWFLFCVAVCLILFHVVRKFGYKTAEGVFVLFCTLGGLGISLWLLWNQMIFRDPLYFIYGPYSAYAQQLVLEKAGSLVTKHNLPLSITSYSFAVIYNMSVFTVLFGIIGAILLWLDKRIPKEIRIASIILFTPFFFNIIALYMGQSSLFIPNLNSKTWFNIRYGIMMIPTIAIFCGYLIHRLKQFRLFIIGLLLFTSFFSLANQDSVVIYDGKYGSSGYDMSNVSEWLYTETAHESGYLLASTAAHDQLMFSSGLPMKRFIHQGTAEYWDLSIAHPERYARWVIARNNDKNDLIYQLVVSKDSFKTYYRKAATLSYTDIYELKSEFISQLQAFPKIERY